MEKTSDILRLAAQYALEGKELPVWAAQQFYFRPLMTTEYHLMCGYISGQGSNEEKCMILCLAAAIAEDAGD